MEYEVTYEFNGQIDVYYVTLSSIENLKDFEIESSVLRELCKYLGCRLSDVHVISIRK